MTECVCPMCKSSDVVCAYVHMLDGSAMYRCLHCGNSWIDRNTAKE